MVDAVPRVAHQDDTERHGVPGMAPDIPNLMTNDMLCHVWPPDIFNITT